MTLRNPRCNDEDSITYIKELDKAGKTERNQETQNCFKCECEDLFLLTKGHRSGCVWEKGCTYSSTHS